ncbi:MAG TPA: sulfatase [Verrucomicrobium sp.]|nr:sulfatase [Verrucomicrobium sp.]
MIAKLSLTLLACTAGLWATFVGAAAPTTPPNVVMIVSDDQAWGDYGFMGHPVVKTPHLDQLAAESRFFPRGYVPSSLCCPSLATIISGQYPHQSFVTSNDPPLAEGKKRTGLKDPAFVAGRESFNQHMDQLATLPRLLKAKGYLSFQTGKWWQGDFTRGGFTHGMTKGSRHGDEGLKIGRGGLQPAYDFMEGAARDRKPFLLWYAPLMPHDPHTPPERLLAKYRDKTPSEHVAKYWAMVEWFDETCGELLAHLKEKGLSENTIVVYLADNGWIQDPNSPRYAPRSKQSQYDGGLRTPILVKWPGKMTPGRSEALASSIDLAPTILDAVGITPPKEMTGINLLDDAAVASRKTLYGEIFTHNSMDLQKPSASLRWRWIIDGDYKFILPNSGNEPEARPELYRIVTDPQEEKNLAPSEPAVVEALSKKLDAWWSAKE